jgi:hypothetical protein
VNPGNSGGPLVDNSGPVIGVNYAFNQQDQNYAISREEAQPLIEELRTGKDIDAIGINGVMVKGELEGIPITGLWVRSVKSGSPADQARIQAGDILTEIEGHILVEETLEGYCSVIRAHSASDTLAVSVIRSGTLEVLKGQLNGRDLEYAYNLTGVQAGGAQTGQEDSEKIYQTLTELGIDPTKGAIMWASKDPIKLKAEGYMGSSYQILDPELKVADFVLSSDITWDTSGGLNGCKFIYRAMDDLDKGKQLQLFVQRLLGAPSWNFQLWDKGKWQLNLFDYWQTGDYIKDAQGTTNTVMLVVQGEKMTPYFNGEKDREATDKKTKLTEGILAFMAWHQSGETTCTFANSWLWVFNR